MVIDNRSREIFKSKSGFCTHRISCVFCYFTKKRLCFFAHFRRMCTCSSFHDNFVCQDIETLTAINCSDGNYQRIEWIIHTGNNSLNFGNDMSSSKNGIHTLMGSRAMGRFSLDFNAEIIAAGHTWTSFKIHIRSIQISPDMGSVNGIYSIQKTVIYVILCTVAGFFGCLENNLYISR